jgi:hypothetical protein
MGTLTPDAPHSAPGAAPGLTAVAAATPAPLPIQGEGPGMRVVRIRLFSVLVNSRCFQRLIEIGQDIIDRFDSDRKAHKIGSYSSGNLLFR